MSKVSNKKLRQVAPRAQDVFARNKEGSQAIASYEGTLTASAAAVIDEHDELVLLAQERRRSKERRAAQAAELVKLLRHWGGPVTLHIPSFRLGEFRPNAEMIDEVINAVSGFLRIVDEHEQQTGVPLSFSGPLHAELVPALESAKAEWAKAAQREVAFTRARRELRIACERFYRDLVAFRSTVADVLGRHDPDYKRLRTSPVRSAGEEVEELEGEGEAEPMTGATDEAAAE